MNLKTFFNQYLRDNRVPVFEYFIMDGNLTFRWTNCVVGFNMPLKIYISGKETIVSPKSGFTSIKTDVENAVIKVDAGYYAASLNMTGK